MSKLTSRQMAVVREMVRMTEAFGNSLLHIMENHGLDGVDGCDIILQVCPKYVSITREINLGTRDSDFGEATLIRGKEDAYWKLSEPCSAEYARLFADEAFHAGKEKEGRNGNAVHSDSLWFCDGNPDAPLDRLGNPIRFDDLPGKEWDPNDSLS